MTDICGLCGKPAEGFAFIGGVRYCHGVGESDPTCYMKAQVRDGEAVRVETDKEAV